MDCGAKRVRHRKVGHAAMQVIDEFVLSFTHELPFYAAVPKFFFG
jgi:hypothetical protein